MLAVYPFALHLAVSPSSRSSKQLSEVLAKRVNVLQRQYRQVLADNFIELGFHL
jgi:hypothetical protein